MTQEDSLEQILAQNKVLDHIKSNRDSLLEMFCALLHAYEKMIPGESCTLEILNPLIWDILRWSTEVRNLFIVQQVSPEEFKQYGGPISVGIVREVIKILEVDTGTIVVKSHKKSE